MSANIPGPNFLFQARDRDWVSERDGEENWSDWYDVTELTAYAKVIEQDGYLVVDGLGGLDEVVHQVRVVFLPEESP